MHRHFRISHPAAAVVLSLLIGGGPLGCGEEAKERPSITRTNGTGNNAIRVCPQCYRRFFGGQKHCTVDGRELVDYDGGKAKTGSSQSAAGQSASSQGATTQFALSNSAATGEVQRVAAGTGVGGHTGASTDSVAQAPVSDHPSTTREKSANSVQKSASTAPSTSQRNSSTRNTQRATRSSTSSASNGVKTVTVAGAGRGKSTYEAPPESGAVAKTTPKAQPAPTPTPRPVVEAPKATPTPQKAIETPKVEAVAALPPEIPTEKVPEKPVSTPKPAPEVVEAPIDVDSLLQDEAALSQMASRGKLSPNQVAALLSVGADTEDKFTKSRTYLTLHFKAVGNQKKYASALDDLLSIPSNSYNPTIRLEQSEYLLGARRYNEAIDAATVAERYRQKFPRGEAYYIRLARTYEVLAKSYEGKFTSSENPDDLDQAIRIWQRYLTHVERKSDNKRVKMAETNISKLERIKEKVL